MGLSTFDMFKHMGGEEALIEISGDRLISLQSVLIGMLSDIDVACRSCGTTYTLGGGTCLGSVRHKGLIPWDDDVDLNMPRGDFPRFAEKLTEMFPGKYWVHVPGETPGYNLAFPRVRLKGTKMRGIDDYETGECGAFIDVFYIDDVPDNPVLRGLHGFVSMALGLAYSCRRFASYGESYLTLVAGDRDATRTFKLKIALGRVLSFRSVEAWTVTWDKWNGFCKNNDSGYVCIPAGRRHYFGEMYERTSYFPVSEGEFEGMRAPLPHDPDAYLTNLYGADYMTPPPEEDRETHVVYEFDLGEYGGPARVCKGSEADV